jgi:pyruvate kinase
MIYSTTPLENFNRTKIIATVGPASADKEMLTRLVEAGVSLFRLNFSHGTYEAHQQVINLIRSINHNQPQHICILQDLQGPKIRVGEIANGKILLTAGQELKLTPEEVLGTSERIEVTYTRLIQDIAIGDTILIDDGKIMLQTIDKQGKDLITRIVYGGHLRSRKGVNLPNTKLSTPSITEKDQQDLQFGLQNEVDWIALSFVRSAQDVLDLKEMIKRAGKSTKVIAKIEKPDALTHIQEIITVSDALMVARGDLGVEIAMERVPMVQKSIVSQCNQAGKPVIIATQMMESMIENPSPTRAETNDIANAVIDGADALMLSGETALGKYPDKVVTEMKKTILVVEHNAPIYNKHWEISSNSATFHHDTLLRTACGLSKDINAQAIICLTQTGWTAYELAKYRPKAAIFVFTDNKALLNTINLVWGVRGYYYDSMVSTDQTFTDLEQFLVQNNCLKPGDVFISMASMPIHAKQRTNMLKINVVGLDT